MASMDTKLAFRNVWRNPRRSILTMAAIAFASVLLVFMLSFQLGSYDSMIDFAVKVHTGDLQVQAKGYNENKDIHKVVADPDKVGKILDSIEDVAAYTFRANAFSLLSSADRTFGAMVIGIEPDSESRVSSIAKMIHKGTYLKPGDDQGAIVGALLAENLKVDVGDSITILGQGRDGSIAATVVTVRGLFRSGQDDFDRSCLQITLDNFNSVYSMRGAVHEVVVAGQRLSDTPTIKNALAPGLKGLGGRYPLVVLDWKQLMPGLIQGIKTDLVSGLIFYAILVIVVAFSIMNTFMMAVFERTREFGVLLAIGLTPGRLARQLITESTMMTAMGLFSGMVMGMAITLYFQSHGIAFSGAEAVFQQFGLPSRIYPSLSWISALSGPAAVLFITILTALYPALRVFKLKPADAMAAQQT